MELTPKRRCFAENSHQQRVIRPQLDVLSLPEVREGGRRRVHARGKAGTTAQTR